MSSMGILGRLLVLLAVLLMPFGMQPSAASPASSHQIAMAAGMEHCPDPSPSRQHDAGFAPCAMACAAALPAQELVRDEPTLFAPRQVTPKMSQTLFAMQPDIPTPPPRAA